METHKWKCPLCVADAEIERLSAEALNLAVMTHIIGHEQRAAQRAVDKARLSCPQTACSLGKDRVYDSREGCQKYRLTDFDERLLRDLKIKPE